MPMRILIVDDHGVLRAGLRALLNAEPDLQVVGEAADGQTGLHLATELSPDLVLMDITMPGMSGIQVTRQLKETLPSTRVLILTLHEDESLLREAIRAGASGYILKQAVEAELISAIRAVGRGDLYIHPAMTRALLKDVSPLLVPEENPTEPLSPRELEVLRLVAQGHTNRQIAEMLHLSVRTVESHRANLMDKLGLSSPAQLVRYAIEHGLLE
jgi:two-component system, NarL family, response regulator NreC